MSSFIMRLLITINCTLVPIYCLHKFHEIFRSNLSNRDLKFDFKLSMYLGLNYASRFLTVWAWVNQVINMIGFFVHDVMKMMDVAEDFRSKLKAFMDKWFYHISWSANFFVTVGYWTVYIYDKELMTIHVPVIGHTPVPLWLDLCIHVLNSVNILLHVWNDENFMEHKNTYWPAVRYHFLYGAWYYLIATIEKLPVYPITDRMVEPYQFLFWTTICFIAPIPKIIIHSIARNLFVEKCRKLSEETRKLK